MPDLATNVLSYGDNLDILRRYVPDAKDPHAGKTARRPAPAQ
jgi:hypothetical protein